MSLSSKIKSFIGVGMLIIFFICALIFLSYVFVIGAGIGIILFSISWLKQRFFTKNQSHTPHIGNVYDQDIDSK